MNLDEARDLYDYNAWANHRILASCEALTGEQFARDMGSSFRSVRDTLLHIMGAEWIWLERWNDRSPTALPFTQPFTNISEVRACWVDIESNLQKFIAGLAATDLDRTIGYRNLRGNPFSYPLRSMLKHLVNHSTYHRGQVTSMLRQLGAKPPATDLLRYYDVLVGNPEE